MCNILFLKCNFPNSEYKTVISVNMLTLSSKTSQSPTFAKAGKEILKVLMAQDVEFCLCNTFDNCKQGRSIDGLIRATILIIVLSVGTCVLLDEHYVIFLIFQVVRILELLFYFP